MTRMHLSLAALLALVACSVGLGAAQAAGLRAAVDGTIYVTYVGTSSLQLRLGDGTAVRSGSTIPAGSYQVLVDDADDTNPKFAMSGPGVSVTSDLNSTGMGIDRPATLGPVNLQPNASYTIQDTGIAGSAVSFSTSASSGGTGGGTGGGGSGGGGGSSGGGSSGGGSSGTATKLLGTIHASVGATGKPALSFGGKTVKTLRKGRYMVSVADHSKKAGFIVGKGGTPAMTLSSATKVGSSSHSVTLSAGKWFFEASSHGPKIYFSVA